MRPTGFRAVRAKMSEREHPYRGESDQCGFRGQELNERKTGYSANAASRFAECWLARFFLPAIFCILPHAF